MQSIINQGGLTCLKCMNISRIEKRRKTTLEKYGVEHSSHLQSIKDKRKNTIKERYGGEPIHTAESRAKAKATMIERYGVEYSMQSDLVKKKTKETHTLKYGVEHSSKVEEIKEKRKATFIEVYGVDHYMKSEALRQKAIATNISKRGVSWTMQDNSVVDKVKQTKLNRYGTLYPQNNEHAVEQFKTTCMEKYGVDNVMKVPEIKEKARISMFKVDKQQQRERTIATNLKKYGVPHTSQSEVVMEKIQRNSKKYKEFTMPSGAVRRVQGYEPFALNELLKAGYTEEQIKTDRADVPRISYESDGKQRVYFPDIWIPHENLIIEVKSTWTASCKTDNIDLKEAATKAAGFNYELWCYDGKGEKVPAAPR